MSKIKEKINGKVVDAIPCTVCPSSDALRVYEKVDQKSGRTYYDAFCFTCHHFEPNPPGYQGADSMTQDVVQEQGVRSRVMAQPTHKETLEETLEDFKTYPIRAIAHRGLTKETCEKYGVRVSLSPHDGETILSHKYPYYRKDKLTGFKERIVEGKIIYSKGDCKNAQLFGSHAHPQGGKTLYITEGELDALSLYQILKTLSNIPGWEPAVVSLSHGAASAARDISNDYDYVNSFDKVVLVFDQDDAGQAAVDDACKILAGKVYIAKLSEKDPNDMLLKGKAEELKWEVLKHARQYMPDNIVNYGECWDRYKNSRNQTCVPFPTLWKDLNQKTYGVRLGELVTITSGCVDKDTEFFTGTGWKKISEYDDEVDKVLQYHEDGTTSLVEPSKYINLPCEKLYSIDTKYGISQTLSEEHRVMYKTSSTSEMKEKTLKDVMDIHDKQVTGFRGLIETAFNFDGGVDFLTDEDLRVQIAVHADGHLHGRKAVIRVKRTRKIARIKLLLDDAGIDYKLRIEDSGFHVFSFYPPMFTKNYHSCWYGLSQRQLQIVKDEVLLWDGNQKNAFYTNDKQDADYIQFVFSATGYRATIQTYKREGRKIEYAVIRTSTHLISFRKTSNSQPKFKEVIPEDGRKYCFTVPTGMLVLRKNNKIFVTGNSGSGKTQFMRELKHHFHETTDYKFADIALEEDVGDSIAGLVSLRLNKRITLPDVKVDPNEEKAAFDYYFSSGRWTGYDYFGGLDDDNLFSKIRFFAATGHKFIFLDHLSIIVSEYAAEGGERERIDTIMTKLAKLVKELEITIFLIVHLKKTTNGVSFEEGAIPSLDDLRGSGSLKQLSMTVLALSRNQQHTDSFCANTSLITVLKCRFTGRTGNAEYLYFNDKTGRMTPVPCPQGYHPEKKGQGGRVNISAGNY